MRRGVLILGVLVLVAIAAFWWRRGRDDGGSPSSDGDVVREARSQTPEAQVRSRAAVAPPGKAPSPESFATEADGVFEVRVSAGGRPVAGAQVRIYLRGPEDPNTNLIGWRPAGSGSSGEDGIARVPAKAGTYLIAARVNGFAAARKTATRPSGERLTRVQLALERGSILRGRTLAKVSRESVPLTELILSAETTATPWVRDDPPAEEQIFGKSDARGNFEIGGLAPGRYTVEAVAVGYARWSRRGVRVPSAGDLQVELSPAAFLEGYVLDGSGKPAAGATVTASGQEEPSTSTTGEGGGFSLEVSGGTFHVSAKRGPQSGAAEGPVTVSVGSTRRGLVVRLGDSSAIEGVVSAASTSKGVAGASVAVSPFQASGDSGRALTGPDGRYSVEGLPPGDYDVVITATGFSEVFRRGISVANGQRFPLDVKMAGTGAVEGRVTSANGAPLEGVRVKGRASADLSNPPAESSTDVDGKYELSGMSLGRSMVTASRGEESFSVNQWTELKDGSPAHVDFVLPETSALTGYVSTRAGAPADSAASVIAIRQGGGGGGWVRNFAAVEPDGRYSMELAPGTYRVAALGASLAEARPKFSSVTLEVNQTARLDLSMPEPEATVTGIVLEPDGTPSPGALISAGVSAGSLSAATLSEADGHFALRATATPQGVVRAVNGGRSGEVANVSAESRNIVIRMNPGATLKGRVVTSGAALVSFSLTVTSDNGQSESRSFVGDHFTLQEVPAGHVHVSVQTPDGRAGAADVTATPGGLVDVDVSLPAASGG